VAASLTIGPVTVQSASLLTDDVRSFLSARPPRYATIATVNPDGTPQQIVIWFLLKGDELVVNSKRGRRWPSNLGRERRANVCVYEGEDAVTLDVTLERVYEGEAARDDIAEMARLYDTPEAAEEEIAVYRTQPRISFVLRPARVYIHGEPR
jgi:hypothetical protein